MTRRGSSNAPSLRAAPPDEYQEETIFDWLRRQSDPVKITPAAIAIKRPEKEQR